MTTDKLKFTIFSILFISLCGTTLSIEKHINVVNGAPEDKPARAEHMFYDSKLHRLLIIATSNETGKEELWKWDGKQWVYIPSEGPKVRELGGAAYDTQRSKVVLFGGMGVNNREDRRGDTWEWDGNTWKEVTDLKIGTRDHHTMCYDENRGKVVLFGGTKDMENLENDTWEWDGMKWEKIATEGPGGRAHFPMVYDSRNKEVILFGGLGEGYKKLNDTWEWDGKKWKEIKTEGPPKRTHHRMAFDNNAGVTVLFGGLKSGIPTEALGDTWIFDGKQWKEIKVKGPERRSGHVMAYDPERKSVFLYGGAYYDGKVVKRYNDTWEWDGEKWKQVQ